MYNEFSVSVSAPAPVVAQVSINDICKQSVFGVMAGKVAAGFVRYQRHLGPVGNARELPKLVLQQIDEHRIHVDPHNRRMAEEDRRLDVAAAADADDEAGPWGRK